MQASDRKLIDTFPNNIIDGGFGKTICSELDSGDAYLARECCPRQWTARWFGEYM